MRTLSASEARSNLYRLMDQTAESHQPIVITGRRHDAVLVSAEDWGAIQETLYLLSVPGIAELRYGVEDLVALRVIHYQAGTACSNWKRMAADSCLERSAGS